MMIAKKISSENNKQIKGTLQFFLGGLLKAKC